MPLYEFECTDCGAFTELRSIADRNQPVACPHCDCEAQRVISAPHLALMAPGLLKAHATNERSAHAPRVRTSHQCGSGCGCAKKSIDVMGTAKKNPDSFGKFQTPKKKKRPWMLGH